MMVIGVVILLIGIFILMEGLMQSNMTGLHGELRSPLHTPARILWWNFDGSIFRTDSVPLGTDPNQYAIDIRRTDKTILDREYYVIDGSDTV